MRLTAILSVMIVAVALIAVSYERNADASTIASPDNTIQVRTYKTEDLPVWNKNGDWDPSALIELIQLASDSKVWESNGGNSTVAPYLHNKSLIITTTAKNHEAVVELLEKLRRNRLAK